MKPFPIHPTTGKPVCPPFWYALGAVIALPLMGIVVAALGVAMIFAAPIWPFVAYFQRRKEIAEFQNGGGE